MVKDHIFPAIAPHQLHDQCGFKPTGSTTAPLVDYGNSVAILLEENTYVRCLLIDFSKAFDSVDYVIIINKLKLLNLPDNIIKYVVSFSTDRDRFTKVGDKRSFTPL